MSTLIIRSNTDQLTSVIIKDLGFEVPPSGGAVTLTDAVIIGQARDSSFLDVLIQDSAYVGGGDPSDHTLILNDGINDIPPNQKDSFFGVSTMVGTDGVNAGAQGLVPQPLAADDGKFLAADGTWTTINTIITVREQDASPSVAVTEIRVPNDSLTDEGGGAVSLDYATANSVASQITAHSGVADAHHTRYTDTEAAAAADYAGRFEGVSIGTGDIGTDKWGWWYDTTNTKLYMVRNYSGALYAVETNPL